MREPTLETPRDGKWIDKWGACKVCGGEIPHGHTESCDIYKLERERDEARHELENTKGTEAIWNAVQELSPWSESNDMEWSDEILCGLFGAKVERDQLRKVCDELCNCIDDCKGHGIPLIKDRAQCYVALNNYSQLPHVKAKQ
jgi:hypothetical protein